MVALDRDVDGGRVERGGRADRLAELVRPREITGVLAQREQPALVVAEVRELAVERSGRVNALWCVVDVERPAQRAVQIERVEVAGIRADVDTGIVDRRARLGGGVYAAVERAVLPDEREGPGRRRARIEPRACVATAIDEARFPDGRGDAGAKRCAPERGEWCGRALGPCTTDERRVDPDDRDHEDRRVEAQRRQREAPHRSIQSLW